MTTKDRAEKRWDRKDEWARKERVISLDGMSLANINIGWLKAKAGAELMDTISPCAEGCGSPLDHRSRATPEGGASGRNTRCFDLRCLLQSDQDTATRGRPIALPPGNMPPLLMPPMPPRTGNMKQTDLKAQRRADVNRSKNSEHGLKQTDLKALSMGAPNAIAMDEMEAAMGRELATEDAVENS